MGSCVTFCVSSCRACSSIDALMQATVIVIVLVLIMLADLAELRLIFFTACAAAAGGGGGAAAAAAAKLQMFSSGWLKTSTHIAHKVLARPRLKRLYTRCSRRNRAVHGVCCPALSRL